MIIKVCGMREAHNIEDVDGIGIDYMGFIFYSKSPRFVAMPPVYLPKCKRIGVFVDEPLETMLNLCQEYNLDGVQLHGKESPDLCTKLKALGYEVIKAFGIRQNQGKLTSEFLNEIAQYEGACDYLLFDTSCKGKGGSGLSFDWNCLADYNGKTPFLLSGGLNPQSIELLKSFTHPNWAGIDLNSGFEDSPGFKNINKLKDFITSITSLPNNPNFIQNHEQD